MPNADTIYRCQYSQCSYTTTKESTILNHSNSEHFECEFCGPSGELYNLCLYLLHVQLKHTADPEVVPPTRPVRQEKLVKRKTPCAFAPRCTYEGNKTDAARHSRYLHLDCPVIGCSAFLTKPAMNTHNRDKHGLVIFGPSREPLQCMFAPSCQYRSNHSSNVRRHSRFLHLKCPVDGCPAFHTMRLFQTHIRDEHYKQSLVQCPQDGCCSPVIALENYWSHMESHSNTNDPEDTVDDPEAAEELQAA